MFIDNTRPDILTKRIFHKKSVFFFYYSFFVYLQNWHSSQNISYIYISLRHCLLSIEFTNAMPRQPTKNQMDIFEIFSIIGFLSKENILSQQKIF